MQTKHISNEFLLQLKSDEGLGIRSKQAAESSHAAFKKVFKRYESKNQGLLLAMRQYTLIFFYKHMAP